MGRAVQDHDQREQRQGRHDGVLLRFGFRQVLHGRRPCRGDFGHNAAQAGMFRFWRMPCGEQHDLGTEGRAGRNNIRRLDADRRRDDIRAMGAGIMESCPQQVERHGRDFRPLLQDRRRWLLRRRPLRGTGPRHNPADAERLRLQGLLLHGVKRHEVHRQIRLVPAGLHRADLDGGEDNLRAMESRIQDHPRQVKRHGRNGRDLVFVGGCHIFRGRRLYDPGNVRHDPDPRVLPLQRLLQRGKRHDAVHRRRRRLHSRAFFPLDHVRQDLLRAMDAGIIQGDAGRQRRHGRRRRVLLRRRDGELLRRRPTHHADDDGGRADPRGLQFPRLLCLEVRRQQIRQRGRNNRRLRRIDG